MRNCALRDVEVVRQQRGHQVAIAVVAYDEIWLLSLQFLDDISSCFCGKVLQVWPHIKPAGEHMLSSQRGGMRFQQRSHQIAI